MNDSHARLQRTLRAIERGERLEAIDTLLIRDVLKQQPPPVRPSLSETVDENAVRGSDAYRVLLQLRRQKQKAARDAVEAPAPLPTDTTPARSPGRHSTKSPEKKTKVVTGKYVAKDEEDRQQQQREEQQANQREASKVDAYRKEMATALATTQRRLEASQLEVERAAGEMEALLAASQRVLSSTFLFERNLTQFCQERSLEVITKVLQRFQHRFYALFFAKWVDYTTQLRREEQRRAVATIVRVVRGHHARKLRRVLAKEALKLQAQARRVVELRVTYRQHQALKLQRVWRRYQWKQHDKARLRRKQAAQYLQQRWRDRKLQRNALISALLNVKQIRAAIRIQKHARGLLTRRALARQKRETHRQAKAMEVLARNASREAMVRWQLERHGAAFVITRAMYPMLIRERFRRLAKLLKRQRAGRVIAGNVIFWYRSGSKYRQRQQASVADRLRELLQLEQARLDTASILIQKTIRRWWYQQKYATQQRRFKKLARIKRMKEKQERLARKAVDGGGRGAAAAAAAIAKASAGLADVMKQARKKNPAQTQAIDVPSHAASRIQRTYLRHRHRVHFQFKRWRQQASDVKARVRRRRHAAITIQRHVRGMQARRVVRGIRARHLLREHIVRWKWRRATRRSQAAKRILRWLKLKHAQRLAVLWKLEKQRQVTMATLLQRWLRRGFFYRKRVARLLSHHRKREEAQLFATQSLVVCTQHRTDELILHSKRGQSFDESVRAYVKGLASSTAKPLNKPPARPRFPILPLIFLVVSGLKDPSKWASMDIKDLIYTKVERSKMIALFKAANKLASASHSPQRRHHKSSETFSMTDVDLAMAKAAGASKSALLFTEFTETLQHLADMKLASVTLWWNKYDGQEARLLALLWQFVFRIGEVTSLVSELTAYVECVVHAHARVVQRLFLRRRDVAQGLLIKLQMLQQREMDKKKRAIIKVQANIRRMLARKIHRARIQAQYEKYIDPEWSMPYWMNPKTGFSTWQKPWVLGDVDVACEAVPFPPSDKILTVPCQGKSGCETCSDWYCYKCDEFFCHACEPKFHKKKDGEQALHEMEKLRKCGLCKFQIASRSCNGCADAVEKKRKLLAKNKKPKPANVSTQEEDAEAEQDDASLYCDVCFAFAHRRGTLQVHKSTPLVELCADCQNDDAILDVEKAPLTPAPLPRAVQWECTTDKKRVCGCCAWSLHPVEACGELTRIQLVTTRMKEHAERLRREQEERERSDTELIRLRELQVKQERAVKKIQRFWHNSAPLIRARRVARALRNDKDATWRQHKQDALVQKTLKYQVRDALGLAHALPSDSVAQRKLREMNALQRRQMGIRARAFGLLLPEYMQLGVPLPGIARVAVGAKYMECSEDLRHWILNRQTIRLKKLPPKEQRDRARRIRFRHQEPPLEDKAWLHDLELWMRDPTDTLLVDVDAKQRITEHNIPLAMAFTTAPTPTPTRVDPKSKKADAPAEIGEPEEYAMFLVEFSMDPTRVVWVSHSLAERFAVWRKQKLREYRERRSLQHKAPDGFVAPPQGIQEPPPIVDAIEETKGDDQTVLPAQYTDDATYAASATSPAYTDPSAWGGYTGYGYDYSSSYAENAWANAASNPWAYNNYQTTAAPTEPVSYDYYSNSSAPSYETASPTAQAPIYDYAASQVVDSTNYFYSEDGNAAAWQAYYAAHPEMAPSYDYSTQSSDPYAYTGYETATYPSQDAWGDYTYQSPYSDPAAAYTTAVDSTYYAAQPTQAAAWEEVFDPATQQTYYYNRETQQTSWENPFQSN